MNRKFFTSITLSLTLAATAIATAAPAGAATSTPRCHGYEATIVGTHGSERIYGTPEVDVIHGLGGNDIIRGLGSGDIICGGNGDDIIWGGNGADILLGGNGNDEILGHAGKDFLNGNAGADLLRGGNHNDTLNGGNGADIIWGGNHHDILNGENGNDRLWGGKGQDILSGGPHADTLNGDTTTDEVDERPLLPGTTTEEAPVTQIGEAVSISRPACTQEALFDHYSSVIAPVGVDPAALYHSLTNELRGFCNLPPLEAHTTLNAGAISYTNEMLSLRAQGKPWWMHSTVFFAHAQSIGDAHAGENLAFSEAPNPMINFVNLIESGSHFCNTISPNYDRVGIGAAPIGSSGGVIVTFMFSGDRTPATGGLFEGGAVTSLGKNLTPVTC